MIPTYDPSIWLRIAAALGDDLGETAEQMGPPPHAESLPGRVIAALEELAALKGPTPAQRLVKNSQMAISQEAEFWKMITSKVSRDRDAWEKIASVAAKGVLDAQAIAQHLLECAVGDAVITQDLPDWLHDPRDVDDEPVETPS